MKILHIITEGDVVGGASIFVRNISRQLVKDGHDVVVATGKPGAFAAILKADEIEWREIPSLRREIAPVADLKAIAEARRLIVEVAPDLVVCHSSKGGVVGRVAAGAAAVPCVFTVHGWAFTEGVPQPQRAVYLVIERLMEHVTSRFVCVSRFDRDLGIAHGFRPGKLVAIHNGIPDTGPEPRHAGTVGRLDVAMIARFSDQKDQATLVRAMSRVAGVRVHFVGDGPTQPQVEALAMELGVADRCVFHGYRPDVDAVLRSCDVFCLTSQYEGFPLTTLEAMRAAMPVIVTDAGGSAEAVEEGVTGYVVARGDVAAVAARLETFRDHPDLVTRMGVTGRQRFLEQFTLERMYANTLAVYRSAAAERGERPAHPRLRHRPGHRFPFGRAGGTMDGGRREWA